MRRFFSMRVATVITRYLLLFFSSFYFNTVNISGLLVSLSFLKYYSFDLRARYSLFVIFLVSGETLCYGFLPVVKIIYQFVFFNVNCLALLYFFFT